ncbi:phosphoadenosine phosphosulfate reductase [Methanosarcinales archaeon]|nr:MAG: phosphoadenosine phosphosulfate reductase [Methanosarcinales archaeon]
MKMPRQKTYLGKLWLHWCENCNLPVLDETCSVCKSQTSRIKTTPPGDIRPAFQYDIGLINHVTEQQYNEPLIPRKRLVVLNRAPYDDRMDEVIFDGAVMGALRFEVPGTCWKFLPRLEGAARIFNEHTDLSSKKGWVIIDQGAAGFIEKGASVLAPGVIDADREIRVDSEVVVLTPNGSVVACGRARMNGDEMITATHGMAVKTRWHGTPREDLPDAEHEWNDAVAANRDVLDRYIGRAREFIKNVASSVNRPITVSYSGGKDSLATLMLVQDTLTDTDFDVLFVDTGLEFPETVRNVEEVTRAYNLNLVSTSAGNRFWETFDELGPPSVATRWCTLVCKLTPIKELIEKHYPEGCLTFIGQRKYESSARAKSEHVWKNHHVENQIGASPIQNWTAMHVWLYLFSKDAPYNRLYEKGFDRIGCWLCPSAEMADIMHSRESHPELWKRYDYALDRVVGKDEPPPTMVPR